ncbi:hypothetical protein [Chitinophaga niabensis]|uniref:Uncharacterized protein n=1 Tax=Chitinophaga niabensis TaxID=536979 RepID=A0A1N6J4R7_9BACT|nr:hypothetical protein [Chitinophaga niabensis]SIO39245.1 hypothetical protein SAMN04488055_3628 [Chitinophaga niabensis]
MNQYQLDSKELSIVTDADWLLHKNRIIEKVFQLFGALQLAMAADRVISAFPVEGAFSPKISKGENYQGLPYVILDYPRLFSRDNIFACRTFFWWGRFFSTTVHLGGEYLVPHRATLLASQALLAAEHWSVCIQDDPWQHHFEANNFLPITSLSPEHWESIVQKSFVKLAKRYELQDWEKIIDKAVAAYAPLLELLNRGPV